MKVEMPTVSHRPSKSWKHRRSQNANACQSLESHHASQYSRRSASSPQEELLGLGLSLVAETDDEVEQSEQPSQSRSDSATLPASRATAYQRTAICTCGHGNCAVAVPLFRTQNWLEICFQDWLVFKQKLDSKDDVPRAGLIRSTRGRSDAEPRVACQPLAEADGRWGSGPEQAWEAQGPLPLHVLPPVGSLDHPKATASLGSGGRPGPSENLLEQFHIGATLTGSAQADYRSTMEQFGNWETPMHVPNCPPPAESVMWIDKRQNPHPADVQAEHQRIFGEMACA
eukprot:s1972_g8.t1